tara:strand:+ start:579 stop:761 length:183 start_codon:yes stop_codon:yes gene_type:complete
LKAFERTRRLFTELFAINASWPGVTRESYGIIENFAHNIIKREAVNIGVRHRTDKIGNLY